MKKQKIIFVYNAKSDFFSGLKDFAHKIVSSETYSCNLCRITHGNFSMKEKWRDFIEGLNFETEFLHKDEFLQKYNIEDINFPSIFIKKEKKFKLLISNKEINDIQNLNELIKLVKKKLKNY